MGLDNGFVLRKRCEPQIEIELCNFRNFHALADFFRREKMLPNKDGSTNPSYEYAVTLDLLHRLQFRIESIYNELIKLPANTVSYYDDNGYPSRYSEMFYANDFDPTSSSDVFVGTKLIRLYQRIDSLREIMENMSADYEVIFYDSY